MNASTASRWAAIASRLASRSAAPLARQTLPAMTNDIHFTRSDSDFAPIHCMNASNISCSCGSISKRLSFFVVPGAIPLALDLMHARGDGFHALGSHHRVADLGVQAVGHEHGASPLLIFPLRHAGGIAVKAHRSDPFRHLHRTGSTRSKSRVWGLPRITNSEQFPYCFGRTPLPEQTLSTDDSTTHRAQARREDHAGGVLAQRALGVR